MKELVVGILLIIVFWALLTCAAVGPALALAGGLPVAIASGMLIAFGILDLLA